MSHPDSLSLARSIIADEARALANLAQHLSPQAARAVDLIVRCADAGGSVLVTGLGKSGHIGAKISATLASLGITSHSVHPSEAAHGDLGRFRSTDTVVCISFSGETTEVVNLAAILRQDNLPIISITGGPIDASGAPTTPPSSLERLATVALRLGVTEEAGPAEFVAPTTSTTATLALGDALALAAAAKRNFTRQDFARRHPGGSLGNELRPVTDVMRAAAGKNLPLIQQSHTVASALREAEKTPRRSGALLIVDDQGKLAGILTDGDIRRLVLRDRAALDQPLTHVMTRAPRTLPDTALVRDAVTMIREFRQDEVPIVDASSRPVGLLDVQDLIALRLIRE